MGFFKTRRAEGRLEALDETPQASHQLGVVPLRDGVAGDLLGGLVATAPTSCRRSPGPAGASPNRCSAAVMSSKAAANENPQEALGDLAEVAPGPQRQPESRPRCRASAST